MNYATNEYILSQTHIKADSIKVNVNSVSVLFFILLCCCISIKMEFDIDILCSLLVNVELLFYYG